MQGSWRIVAKAALAGIVLVGAFWFALVTGGRQHGPDPRPAPPELLTARPVSQAVPSGDEPLIVPVAGVRADDLSDTFSQARASGARRHDAIDILAPRGTPVIAAAAGKVEKLFLSRDGGNTVYVRSADARRIYYYAHLDSYAPGLREGMVLDQGDAIGAVGSTGNADPTAPHLHFAVWMTEPSRKWWEQAIALNPFPLLTGR
jgi:peptidoglycan LD-endopeptidase LytH